MGGADDPIDEVQKWDDGGAAYDFLVLHFPQSSGHCSFSLRKQLPRVSEAAVAGVDNKLEHTGWQQNEHVIIHNVFDCQLRVRQ